MTTIHTTARVGPDGTITIPVGDAEVGKEVEVTVKSAPPKMTQKEWEDFIDRTAGSIDDPTFERPPQGDYEERQSLE